MSTPCPLASPSAPFVLQLPDGARVAHDALDGDVPVTAFELKPSRAEEELARFTALAAERPLHPRLPSSLGRRDGWLWVPRLVRDEVEDEALRESTVGLDDASEELVGPTRALADPTQALGDVPSTEVLEAPVRDLLARLAPALDRSGNVDPTRTLRQAGLDRARLDRWLASTQSIAFEVGPDLGGLDARAVRREQASGRCVALSLRRARTRGVPLLDAAAGWVRRVLAGASLELDDDDDPRAALARVLASIHVVARETTLARDEARERALALLRALVKPQLDAVPKRAPREPFWTPEPARVRRRRLFTRFDRGIRYDDEGLYSATPESLAVRVVEGLSGRVLDGTCGIGSLAIAAARESRVEHVVAVDRDANRLAMAAHNAGVYEVAARIEFVHGSVDEVLASHGPFDAVLLDPPWGGRAYDRESIAWGDFPIDLDAVAQLHTGTLRIKLPKSLEHASVPSDFTVEPIHDERGVLKFVLARRER